MQKNTTHWNFISKIKDNPIVSKELTGRMRGKQGFILLTAYLTLISLVIAGMYYYSVGRWDITGMSPDALQEMGKQIFNMVVLFEFLLIVFIGPALTSGAISSERERQTFDLLRISLLSSRAVVLGKLGAAVAYLLLLILAALPLQSLAFFLGGVGLPEMLISLLMLTTSTFLFCTLGIYFSGIAKRTVVATVVSYAVLILPVIFAALLFFFITNNALDLSSKSIEYQRALIIIIWMLLSSNPFTAAFLAQTMLEEEQALFFFNFPDFSVTLFSPWILYTVFSVTMTLLMIWLIVFYMNRYER